VGDTFFTMRILSGLVLALTTVAARKCAYKETRGSTEYKFDLSSLTRSGAQRDFHDNSTEYDYEMNVCTTVRIGGLCTEQNAVLCQIPIDREAADPFILARDQPVYDWALIDDNDPRKGIKATFDNGDPCGDEPRRVTMEYHCDEDAVVGADATDLKFNETEKCVYTTSLKSRSACPMTHHDAKTFPSSGVVNDHKLVAGAWAYWTITVRESDAQLLVELFDYAEGDPDVYIKKGVMPTRDDFDFRGSSSNEYERLSITYDAETNPLTEGDYYIGVYAYGSHNAIFTLTAETRACIENCNRDNSGGTCNARSCNCNEGFISPPEANDCTARLIDIAFGERIEGKIGFVGSWNFYRVEVRHTSFEMVVNGDVTFPESRSNETRSAMVALYLKKDDFPSREDNDVYDTLWSSSTTDQLQARVSGDLLTTGTWIIGFFRQRVSRTEMNYQLVVNLNNCPQGCSGHGQCDDETHVCACDVGFRARPDCSQQDERLVDGVVTDLSLQSYEMKYFHINVPKEVAAGMVELVVESKQQGDIHPMLYMAHERAPARLDAEFVSPGGNITIITLSPSELLKGTWYLGLNNMNYEVLNTSLSFHFRGICLNGCSGQGTCDVMKGAICVCNEGFLGGDCSVNEEDFEEGGGGVGGGTVFFLILLFSVLGVGLGIYIKKSKPDLFEGSTGRYDNNAAGMANQDEQYNIEDHMNMTLGADYISMQQGEEEETR